MKFIKIQNSETLKVERYYINGVRTSEDKYNYEQWRQINCHNKRYNTPFFIALFQK